MSNTKKVLNDICDYAIYNHSLKLEYGDELECIQSSADYYQVKLGNIENSYTNGEEIYYSIDDNSPKVGIDLSIWWDYYKNEKDDFSKACLLGFLAIKSILQNKAYCKIDNRFWLARMDGRAKSINDVSDLSKELQPFSNHYQTRKIKKELRVHWNLKTYSHYTRGFYVSFQLELEQLIFEAEKRRKSTLEKQHKEREKKARLLALQKLGVSQP
ncbi:hypothetical protein [Aquimarina celericrescens]|uniref:Uncharacterized protein n=1 Tax=Aquimarina celericrescens TaxID=1964542 RepID=A0ABW5AUS9_9FLAO